MDQPARQQIRLILDDASDRARRDVDHRIQALRRTQASRGALQSGSTAIYSITIIEEVGSNYIDRAVDRVSAISRDVDAFAMLSERVDAWLDLLTSQLEAILDITSGGPDTDLAKTGYREAVLGRFLEARKRLDRQLELHRFAFTVSASSSAARAVADAPTATVEKPKGGKPLAAHWDEMWAAIAVALYSGDLRPRTQADIERAMSDWLVAKGLDAAASTVRTRARPLWRRLEEAE